MRSNNSRVVLLTFVMVAGFATLLKFRSENVRAQAASPTMLVPNLAVRTVVTGLVQPTSIAFIGDNDFLVLEKASAGDHRMFHSIFRTPRRIPLTIPRHGLKFCIPSSVCQEFSCRKISPASLCLS